MPPRPSGICTCTVVESTACAELVKTSLMAAAMRGGGSETGIAQQQFHVVVMHEWSWEFRVSTSAPLMIWRGGGMIFGDGRAARRRRRRRQIRRRTSGPWATA